MKVSNGVGLLAFVTAIGAGVAYAQPANRPERRICAIDPVLGVTLGRDVRAALGEPAAEIPILPEGAEPNGTWSANGGAQGLWYPLNTGRRREEYYFYFAPGGVLAAVNHLVDGEARPLPSCWEHLHDEHFAEVQVLARLVGTAQ